MPNWSSGHLLKPDLKTWGPINTDTKKQRQMFLPMIEPDLNRGVYPFGPIRRQDTKVGGCHLAFFPDYSCNGARAE